MKCKKCGGKTGVHTGRLAGDGYVRYRRCYVCGSHALTLEVELSAEQITKVVGTSPWKVIGKRRSSAKARIQVR